MKLKERIKTYNFWVSLSSAVFLVLKLLGEQFNFNVDEGLFSDIFTTLCGILVILGIIVPPTSKAIDEKTTFTTECLFQKEETIESEPLTIQQNCNEVVEFQENQTNEDFETNQNDCNELSISDEMSCEDLSNLDTCETENTFIENVQNQDFENAFDSQSFEKTNTETQEDFSQTQNNSCTITNTIIEKFNEIEIDENLKNQILTQISTVIENSNQ